MATIDELSIEVQSSAKKVDNSIDKAAKQLEHLASATSKVSASKLNSISVGLNNISKSLRGLKDVSSAIKSLQGLSNISNATKGLEKVKKSADGLKDIKADIDTKDFDSAVDELQKRFKDVGTDFSFKGDSAKLEKTISNLENSLDRLYEKQDEMRDLGVDFDSRGFVKLQRDIALTSNKLEILNSQMEKIKKARSELPKNFTIERGENKADRTTKEQTRATTVSTQSLGYNKEAMRAVFGEGAQDIKDFSDAVKKLGSDAATVLNGIETNFEKIGNSSKKALGSTSDVGDKLKKSFKDAELSTDKFEEYLENLQIPDIRTDNLKKLQSELERTEKKLDELTVKSDNWSAKGVDPDSSKFRNLQEQIVATSKKSEALRKKIKEVSQTRPNVSGWQKLTTVASTIDKAFGAIKRGVSSALSSIKKLGRGFQNLGSVVKKVSSAIGKMFNNIVQLASKATSAITSSVKSMTNAFSKLRGESSGIQRASSGLSGLVKMAGGLLAVKGVSNFGKSAIELGSNITEVENIVETAFGSMSDMAYNFASSASENFGLSELAAKQYSGTMMSMLRSSNITQKEAANMSISLTGLAGDIASFYNIDTETAFMKLRSAMSGETEAIKQLGINMNVANLEAYALANGISKSYKEMTIAEQTAIRYNYIMEKSKHIQGDYAKTANTFANQLRLLKLNLQSIAAVIGQGLIAAILPAIKMLNKLMEKLMQAAKVFRDFMYVLFGKKIESPARGIVDDMAGITDYTADMSSIGDSADDMADGMDDASGSMDSAESSAKKLKKSLSSLGFDELNQLNAKLDDLDTSKIKGDKGKDNKLGLDDIGTSDMSGMFDDFYDKKEIEPINKWAAAIRKAFLSHDWEGLGKTIAQMVNVGLKNIYKAINSATPKVEKALKAFAKTFNSFVEWLDWDLLGRTVGSGVNLVAKSFNALFGPGGINLEGLGKKLSVGFRGLVNEVDWRGIGNALGNAFMIPWRIAYGFIKDMWRIDPDTLLTGWTEAGISLAEGIHGIFKSISFAKIGKTISDGFNGITEIISSFRKELEGNKTLKTLAISISDGFNNIIDYIDLGKATKEIGELTLRILGAMTRSAELTHWEDFGYKVAEGLYNIPWLDLFNQVFSFVDATFGESARGFVGFLTEHSEELGEGFANAFNMIFEKIQYIANSIPWDEIGVAISSFLNTAIEKIKPVEASHAVGNFVTSLLGTMLQVAQKTKWNALGIKIGEFLTNIPWSKIIGNVFTTITTIFGGLITGLGGTIIEKMPEIGTSLATGFNYAFQRLDEFVSSISWADIGLYISTGLNNMITGIDWATAGATFGELVKGLVDTIFVIAANTDWLAFGYSIGEFLNGIPWLEILTEVALGLSGVIGEVLLGLSTTTSGQIIETIGFVILAAKGVGLGNSALEMVNEFAKNFGLLPEGAASVIPVLAEKIGLIAGEEGILHKISSVAETVASKAGSFLGTIGSVVFSPTGALIGGIVIGVALIVANWDKIKEAAGKVKEWVSEKFGQLKENVKESMKNIAEGAKEGWEKTQEKFQKFDEFLTNIFSHDWSENFGSLGEIINGFSKNVENVWESVKRIFRGVIDFVAGIFTGDWSRAWSGIKDIFGGIWNGLESIVKSPINAIIGIMNSLIEAVAFAVNSVGKILSGLNIDVPDWVPIIGGKKLSFNFPKWTPGKFPYLEQGGILKRGQVGILEGNGAEAVIPLERNRQWISKVSEEMARSSYNYSGGINEEMLANAVAEGVAMALMNNIDNLSSNNQQPMYITLALENDEAIARAAIRGQQSIDYRMNPTPQHG